MKRTTRILIAKSYLAWRREGRRLYWYAGRNGYWSGGECHPTARVFLPSRWLLTTRKTNPPLPVVCRSFERERWHAPTPTPGKEWVFGQHCNHCGRLVCPDCGHTKRNLLRRKWRLKKGGVA